MKYFLLFFLPLLALGEGARAAPAAGPKMGPEIELRGKKQVPSVVCQVAPPAAVGLALAGFAGTLAVEAKSIYQDEHPGMALVAPIAAGSAAAMASFTICFAVVMNDSSTTDGYLRKIRAQLLPMPLNSASSPESGPSASGML